MKKIITVSILDTNRFFALGIQHILVAYFQLRGQKVFFVSAENAARADVVFWATHRGYPVQLCRLKLPAPARMPIFIIVCTEKEQKTLGHFCVCEHGSLWRRARPHVLLTLLNKELEARKTPVVLKTTDFCCPDVSLTARELEVMRYMKWEMAPGIVSHYLKLSPKTISGYKRSVMRKLGFERNEELYHWLRSGGLEQVKR